MGLLDDLKKDKMKEQSGGGGHIGVGGDFADSASDFMEDAGQKLGGAVKDRVNDLIDKFKGNNDDEDSEKENESEGDSECEEESDDSSDGDGVDSDEDSGNGDSEGNNESNNDGDSDGDSDNNSERDNESNSDEDSGNGDSEGNNESNNDGDSNGDSDNKEDSDNKKDSENNEDSNNENSENNSENNSTSDSSDSPDNNSSSGDGDKKEGLDTDKNKNKKNKNTQQGGPAQAGDDLSKDGKKGIAEKAADRKAGKAMGKGAQEGAKKGVQEAGKKGVQEATKKAAEATVKKATGQAATKALAAAGPWGAAAAAAIQVICNPEVLLALILTLFLFLFAGIMIIFMALAVIALLLKACFEFVFSILIPKEEEELTEDSTPEERYTVIAKIIKKKVKDDYNDMISTWKKDLKSRKNDSSINSWGIALENNGYATPNLNTTDEAALIFKLGSGWDADEQKLHTNWASPDIYKERYPEGLKDSSGNELVGTEPYFDYEYSRSMMDDKSNNGAIKNMAYLVAGYNASRAEMPINESGKSWWARTLKSYYWDITADTWWTDIKSWIGVEDYFNYSSKLITEERERNVSTYQALYWEDIVVQKRFIYKVDITYSALDSYGISSDLKSTAETKHIYVIDPELKTYMINYYETSICTDLKSEQKWNASYALTNDKLQTIMKELGNLKLNSAGTAYYPSSIWWYSSYYVRRTGGQPLYVYPDGLDDNGKDSASLNYYEWYETATNQKYYEQKSTTTPTNPVAGSIRYQDEVKGYEAGDFWYVKTAEQKTKPSKIDNKTAATPYYQATEWVDKSTISDEYSYNGTGYPSTALAANQEYVDGIDADEKVEGETKLSKTKPTAEAGYYYKQISGANSDGEYTWQKYKEVYKYKIKTYKWECDIHKYKIYYTYNIDTYVNRGVKVDFTVTLDKIEDYSTATFNKSWYKDEKKTYSYSYVDANSSAFDNSKFVELMFEKNNPYYDTIPTTVSVPAYYEPDGTYHPVQYNISFEEASNQGIFDISKKPKQTDDPTYTKKDAKDPLIGGIKDWPYYGNVTGFEYECGAVGVFDVCTARPTTDEQKKEENADKYDQYNTHEEKSGGSCGCGKGPEEEEMDESEGDVSTMRKNTVIKSNLCEMITEKVVYADSSGNPILDPDGNKVYVEKTRIKTVEDRINEICVDFQNFLANYDAVEAVANLGIVSNNYGNVSELTVFTVEMIKDFEGGRYDKVTQCGSLLTPNHAIGIFQWTGDEAIDLIKNICDASPSASAEIWAAVIKKGEYGAGSYSPDDIFLANRTVATAWTKTNINTTPRETYTVPYTTYEQKLMELLYLDSAQDIQDLKAASEIQKAIDKLNSTYGITDPAALAWFADAVHQLGWDKFVAEYNSIISSGIAIDGKLLGFYTAYLNQYSKTDANYDRRSAFYNDLIANQASVPKDWQAMSIGQGADGVIYETTYSGSNVINVVYYNQAAGWIDYGGSTAADAACGPTSCAIVASTFLDANCDPNYMIKWALDNGMRVEGSGSSHAIIDTFCTQFGLTVEHAKSKEEIPQALAEGNLVVMLAGSTGSDNDYYTGAGHFFVIRGVTEEGKLLMADPGSQSKTDNTEGYVLDYVWNNRKKCCSDTHVWIISKP